jgi:hypothetical protein
MSDESPAQRAGTEIYSLTAKGAKAAKENNSLTAKDAKGITIGTNP